MIYLPTVDLTRFDLRSLHCEVRLDIFSSDVLILCRAGVRNVEDGQFSHLNSQRSLPDAVAGDPRAVRKAIKEFLSEMLLHELDETLWIDGERLCKDPHPELKRFEEHFGEMGEKP